MKELLQRLKDHMHKLSADLKPMSFSEKLDHLWTYYKWVAVVLAVILVITLASVSFYQSAQRETLFNGMLVNVDITLDGRAYLTDGYRERRGGVKGDQEVTISSVIYEDPKITQDYEFAVSALQKFMAYTAAMELDYLLADKQGMVEFGISQDAYLDLREVLTQAELAQLAEEEALIYVAIRDEDDQIVDQMPVAVNLKDHPFRRYIRSEGEYYLGFINNTQRQEYCRDFWEYLLAAQENNGDLEIPLPSNAADGEE